MAIQTWGTGTADKYGWVVVAVVGRKDPIERPLRVDKSSAVDVSSCG